MLTLKTYISYHNKHFTQYIVEKDCLQSMNFLLSVRNYNYSLALGGKADST